MSKLLCLLTACLKRVKQFMLNKLIFFMDKEVRLMMAMLWTQQILLGKKKYSDVPRLLKPKVKELLIDAGYEELVTE